MGIKERGTAPCPAAGLMDTGLPCPWDGACPPWLRVKNAGFPDMMRYYREDEHSRLEVGSWMGTLGDQEQQRAKEGGFRFIEVKANEKGSGQTAVADPGRGGVPRRGVFWENKTRVRRTTPSWRGCLDRLECSVRCHIAECHPLLSTSDVWG